MRYFKLHIGDFVADTVGLSLVERGAYMALLSHYYATEKPIADDEKYRVTGASNRHERAAVEYVLTKFFHFQNSAWRQKRADAEIVAFEEKSAKARASINCRWAQRDTNVLQTNDERNTNHEPLTIKKHKSRGATAPPATKPTRAHRLPKDWQLPDDWSAWAVRERPGWTQADSIRVSLLFRDHWHGNGKAMADWEATWRNWVRRERGPQAVSGKASVMAQIWEGYDGGERNSERSIDGESTRVA